MRTMRNREASSPGKRAAAVKALEEFKQRDDFKKAQYSKEYRSLVRATDYYQFEAYEPESFGGGFGIAMIYGKGDTAKEASDKGDAERKRLDEAAAARRKKA